MKPSVSQPEGPLRKNPALLAVEFVLVECLGDHPGEFHVDSDEDLMFTAACGREVNVSIAMRHARWFYFSMTLAQQKKLYLVLHRLIGLNIPVRHGCFETLSAPYDTLLEMNAHSLSAYAAHSGSVNEMLRFGIVAGSVAKTTFFRVLLTVVAVNRLADVKPVGPISVVRSEEYLPAMASKDFLPARFAALVSGNARAQACLSTSAHGALPRGARLSLQFPRVYGSEIAKVIPGHSRKLLFGSEREVIFPPGLGVGVNKVELLASGGIRLAAEFYRGPALETQDFYLIDLALKQVRSAGISDLTHRIRTVFYVDRVIEYLFKTSQNSALKEALLRLKSQQIDCIKIALVFGDQAFVGFLRDHAIEVTQFVLSLKTHLQHLGNRQYAKTLAGDALSYAAYEVMLLATLCDSLGEIRRYSLMEYTPDKKMALSVFCEALQKSIFVDGVWNVYATLEKDNAQWEAFLNYCYRAQLATEALPTGKQIVMRYWHDLAAVGYIESLSEDVCNAIGAIVARKADKPNPYGLFGARMRQGLSFKKLPGPRLNTFFSQSLAYEQRFLRFSASRKVTPVLPARLLPLAICASKEEGLVGADVQVAQKAANRQAP